jgi:hypothetical protein
MASSGTASPARPHLVLGERDARQALPEAASTLRVVCGKLDERELNHAAIVAPPRHVPGRAYCPSEIFHARAPRRCRGRAGRARARGALLRAPRRRRAPRVLLFGKRGGRQLRCHVVTRAHSLPLYGKHRLAP